jgi:hypothetical protein
VRPIDWRHALLLCLFVPALLSARQVTSTQEASQDATQDLTTIQVPAAGQPEGIGEDTPVIAPAVPPDELRRQSMRRLSRSPMARVTEHNDDGTISFYLQNRLHAPVTVEVDLVEARDAIVNMALQKRTTVAPLERVEVARIRGTDFLVQGSVDFLHTAVIGDPKARHDDRVVYAWPFPKGAVARLTQGPRGPTHRELSSQNAIDLAVPEGTPVLAARAGTVVFLESRYFESGMDRVKYLSRSNQVRILHDDGSMATYAHLYPKSIDLEPGQRVEVGQQIGLSGNTGYSSGPHLHFAVLVNRDMNMVSVPFHMQGVDPNFTGVRGND